MVTKRPGAGASRARTPELRDREATRQRFLEAFERLLGREGFSGLGVNAVAREARSDKVLLYRYFGGIEGLLEAWGERAVGRLPPAEPAAGPAPTLAERATSMLLSFARSFRTRPELLEVMRWELVEDNALTRRLAQIREQAGQADLAGLELSRADAERVDLPAIAAILSAGMLHLSLRARTAPEWLGIPIRTEEGWRRLEGAAASLVRALLAADGEEVP